MLNLPIKNKLICSYKKHECGKNNSLPRVRSEENMQKVRQKGSKYNSFILSNKEKQNFILGVKENEDKRNTQKKKSDKEKEDELPFLCYYKIFKHINLFQRQNKLLDIITIPDYFQVQENITYVM